MRKLFLLLPTLLLCLASCEKVETDLPQIGDGVTENGEAVKKFTFHVKGDFTKSFEEMTRAAVRLENDNSAGVTDLWVLDYDASGKLVQQVHQTATQEGVTFGSVAMSLTYGHHDVKFIASKGTEPVLTASALSWGRVKDTFILDYPVDVQASSNGNRAPELKRAVCGVCLMIADKVPANAKSIKVEFERSQSLILPSLTAGAVSLSGVTNDIPASWVGVANNSFNVYSLCPDDEMVTDVHVTVMATDGSTLTDFTINDVTLQKNHMTVLKGECFGRGSGFSVALDNTWDTPLEVMF